MTTATTIHKGLNGVVISETTLSHIDGEKGQVVIRGEYLQDFTRNHTYESAMADFLNCSESKVRQGLYRGRMQAWEIASHWQSKGATLSLMQKLLTSLSVTGDYVEDALTVTGALGVGLAVGVGDKRTILEPDPKREHIEDVLRMGFGRVPDIRKVRALHTYLLTVCEHGFNASTFTARVVASTGVDMNACIVAAISALKGPLHGGAPGPVLDMLDEISSPDQIEVWLRQRLDSKQRIMGFGHRVYRVRDPRAAILEQCLVALRDSAESPRLRMGRLVEQATEKALAEKYPARNLKANVEFYTALLLEELGFERQDFTAVFAVGRVLGWAAHVVEQVEERTLIRPTSSYVGRFPEC